MAKSQSTTGASRDEYAAFLEGKSRRAQAVGFDCQIDAPYLFPFQRVLTEWALRRGRAAIFAATGLGKTRMEIEWASRVADHSGGRVLVLAPLAVAGQTVTEGAKIGIEVAHCRDGSEVRGGITVTNYDRLHRFDPSMFDGVVLDESSCIKHQDSKTLATMLDAFSTTTERDGNASAERLHRAWDAVRVPRGRDSIGDARGVLRPRRRRDSAVEAQGSRKAGLLAMGRVVGGARSHPGRSRIRRRRA